MGRMAQNPLIIVSVPHRVLRVLIRAIVSWLLSSCIHSPDPCRVREHQLTDALSHCGASCNNAIADAKPCAARSGSDQLHLDAYSVNPKVLKSRASSRAANALGAAPPLAEGTLGEHAWCLLTALSLGWHEVRLASCSASCLACSASAVAEGQPAV